MSADLADLRVALTQAAADLVRRRLRILAPVPTGQIIDSAEPAHAAVRPLLDGLDHERFVVAFLARNGRLLGLQILTIGSASMCIVDAGQIFRAALQIPGCVSVVMAHNHPSGDPTPSREDRARTDRAARAGGVIGISVADHIIVGGAGYTSLAALGGLLAPWPEPCLSRDPW